MSEPQDPRPSDGNAVTPEAFVEAWNSSTTAAEVARKLGMPHPVVLSRAMTYRAAGINLKTLRRSPSSTSGPTLGVSRLNRLIASLEGVTVEELDKIHGEKAEESKAAMEAFAKVWNAASSSSEAARRTGMTHRDCVRRARECVREGLSLKMLPKWQD